MKYKDIINRLEKLIGCIPPQSQLCRITGVKQSTMSQRAKDNSSFKLEDIEKLNKYFGINLYTFKSNNNQNLTAKQKNTQAENLLNSSYNYSQLEDYSNKIIPHFSIKLAQLQNSLGLSDKETAKILRLYTDEYIELKIGIREPNLKILTLLKENFKISIDEFLFGKNIN